jgi:hypothetical protein
LTSNTQALDPQVLTLIDVLLSDFAELGVLLLYLNGVNGCSSTTSRKRSSAMAFSFARYVDTAKLRILNPLRVDSRFDNFAPMIKVISQLLEAGWIYTVRDLEHYLIETAKVSRAPLISELWLLIP